MNKNTQTILGAILVGAVGYFLYKKYIATPKVTKVGGNMKVVEEKSFAGNQDELFSELAGQKMVVGGYNAQTNQTYVYPEGNMGGGYFVKGRVNVPSGTTYTSTK